MYFIPVVLYGFRIKASNERPAAEITVSPKLNQGTIPKTGCNPCPSGRRSFLAPFFVSFLGGQKRKERKGRLQSSVRVKYRRQHFLFCIRVGKIEMQSCKAVRSAYIYNQHSLLNIEIMRFGINTFLFTSPFTTESVSLFPQFKQWGFDSVEIALEDASHIDPVIVKKALDDNGLVCGSICAAMGGGRDLRGAAEQQQQAFDYLKALINISPALGHPTIFGSGQGRAGGT